MNKGILFSVCLLIFLTACSLSKNVRKHQFLLKKVEVNLTQEGSVLSASDLYALLRQQPNQKVIRVPIRLMIYNAVDSAKVAQKRLNKNEKSAEINVKRNRKMDHINARRIAKARKKGQEFYSQKIIPLKDTLNPQRFFREWLKYKYGESPVIYDSTLCGISQSQLVIFLRKKGFYETQITPQILKDVEKRTVTIRFDVSAGLPYKIDSISTKGPIALTNLYKAYLEDEQKKKSEHPIIGKPLDEDMLAFQAEEVARYFRNFGLYGFTGDNLRYEVDTNARTKRAKLLVQFLPRKAIHPEIKDSLVVVPFEKYVVNRVFFHLSDSNKVEGPFDKYKSMKSTSNEGDDGERGFLETYESLIYAEIKCDKKAAKRFKLTKSDINPFRVVELYFNGEKPGVRPHLLELQNYLESTNIYKDKYAERSYQFLNQLDLFSSIKPVLKENVAKKSVDVHYYLTQSKIQSFAFEPRFTSSFGLLGVNASINYQNKNVFRGGERLSISLGGGFDSQPVVFDDGVTEGRTFNTFEFGPNLKLEIPGLFPVPVWVISKRQKPSTVFNAAANVERRDIFDRSVLQFSYTWKWLVGKTQVFTVGLPFMSTIKFVRFKKDDFFEAQINDLNDLFLRNSYSNQLVWEDFKFQFEWSNLKKDYRADEGHSARKILADLRYLNTISLAGNTLRRFSNQNDTLSGGIQTVFGNAFAQFIRTDHQFTIIRRFKSSLQFAAKISAGVGVPYGNSTTSMPYDYSFFGGGPNDNRGWKARSLGPGVYRGYRDSTGTVTQLGDIRLFGSLEFRFPLGGILSSCIFSDFGNIWIYRKDDNREGAEFTKEFYRQLAFTLGTGLRFDLSILIVRVDVGFPIFNPALPSESKWIFNTRDAYYLDGAQYYGYNGTIQEQIQKAKERLPRPFIPSLNFGIGLPF